MSFIFSSLGDGLNIKWKIKAVYGNLRWLFCTKVVGCAVLSLEERIKLAHIDKTIVVEVAFVLWQGLEIS